MPKPTRPATRDRPRRPTGRQSAPRAEDFSNAPADGEHGIDPTDIGLGVRLVHEDHDVIVIDKPTGLITAAMPGTPEHDNIELRENSAFAVVKRYIKDKRRQRGTRIWIIHRLDKEASGLIVFAASDRAFTQLKESFRSKRVHRLYMAVAEGEIRQEAPSLPGRTPQPPSGIIRSSLAEGRDGLMRSVTPRRRGDDPGQLAVTHWRTVAAGSARTLLQLRLDTGRKNQIRVHMKEFGHPLAGDRRYGGTTNPISRLCLHATELGFTHPGTGRELRFFSPPPQAFYGLVGEQAPPNTIDGRPTMVGEPAAPPRDAKSRPDTSWDHVAEWYDELIGERKSDHHENVILPGTLRLLQPAAGMKVLDLACGQGDFCRRLSELGVVPTGIDTSPRLIESAQASAGHARFLVGDVRDLPSIPDLATAAREQPFDAATSVMAMMNIDPIEPVLMGVASLLKPGGSLVMVILHPAFRAPGQTSWGWDGEKCGSDGVTKRRSDEMRKRPVATGKKPTAIKQYRRVDGYLSPGQSPIVMNPGSAAHGADEITTWTFHRPIQTYSRLLSEAGFAIDLLEEWPSIRTSAPGPRAAEENRARREIPMFLAIRAIRAR
ncbi:MAG: methyltransferase domain-containing protein [Phycisphaerales bacterium]|nr:methyltransferase domain-containing protein [Phycisphaerales bacterium]